MNAPAQGWIVWAGRRCAAPSYPIRLSVAHEDMREALDVAARLRRLRPAYQFTVRSVAASDRISAMYRGHTP